jgi:hypothetical protein
MQEFSLRLDVSYSQYTLEGGGWDPDLVEYSGGNGLVWSTAEAAVVLTGIDTGHLPVSIVVNSREPVLELEPWDEVVEVSIMISNGTLVVCSPVGEYLDEVDLGADADDPSAYRLRVHARGRDKGREAFSVDADKGDTMVEYHHIVLWPAPIAPETRLKLTDQIGMDLRGAN